MPPVCIAPSAAAAAAAAAVKSSRLVRGTKRESVATRSARSCSQCGGQWKSRGFDVHCPRFAPRRLAGERTDGRAPAEGVQTDYRRPGGRRADDLVPRPTLARQIDRQWQVKAAASIPVQLRWRCCCVEVYVTGCRIFSSDIYPYYET